MEALQLRDQAQEALRHGDVETARVQLRQAALCPSGNGQVLQEIAGALWALYDFDSALETYRRAAELEPKAIQTHLLAARKLFSIGRFRDCAGWLEQALASDPTDVSVRIMLGEVYDRGNRLEEAERSTVDALAVAPQEVKAVRLMAHLERRRGQFDQARRRLADHLRRFPGPEDWRLRYELAAVLDRLGEYDGAMTELLAAKEQLAPQSRGHFPEALAIRQRQKEVLSRLNPSDLDAWRGIRGSIAPPLKVALLCGHPRSGTTLLERILDSHPGLVCTDETGILSREFIEPIIRQALSARESVEELQSFGLGQIAAGRAAYLRFTQAHLGTEVGGRGLVEKDPSLTPDLPLPLRLFPEARVIFPLRDPRDVCVSYFFTLLPLNAVSVAAADLRSTFESCAHSLASWHHWREMLPHPWLETRYEELVSRPESEVRRLVDFLDLSWDDGLLRFHERAPERGVRTPTYADVAQPVYRRAVGRWRNYEKYLAPHMDILRPWLRAFGYA